MDKPRKLLSLVLSGTADANVPFTGLCHLLLPPGFVMRTRGSHHVFRKAGIEEMINLQKDGNKAKPYQVRQVRALITRYSLGGAWNGPLRDHYFLERRRQSLCCGRA